MYRNTSPLTQQRMRSTGKEGYSFIARFEYTQIVCYLEKWLQEEEEIQGITKTIDQRWTQRNYQMISMN